MSDIDDLYIERPRVEGRATNSHVPLALPKESDGESEQEIYFSTELRTDLKETHVNMITFAACIGVGLFLQSGQVVFLAGPGLAILAYLMAGSVIWATMGSLGEMSALFPMSGGIFLFPARFLDEGIGYAAGWLTWFTWTVIVASEVMAVAQLFRFQFEPDYLESVGYPDPVLEWEFGQKTSPLIWVGLCLVLVFLPNCLPVRWYGRLEYCLGTIKIIFLVGLIFLNTILNAIQRVKHTNGRFWTYQEPFGFAAANISLGYPTKNVSALPLTDGINQALADGTYKIISGSSGVFLGMWSAITTVIFSMIGFETISVTASENADLKSAETIKIATRKISLRIIILYTLCCFCAGLNVPYTDYNLENVEANAVKGGQNSIFMLSLVRNHIRGWPHFLNCCFIFSAFTSAMNSLYLSSRILHALARCESVWPPANKRQYYLITEFRSYLARTIGGVPYCAVFVSWLFGFLAFLAVLPNTSIELGRLATSSIVSMLLVYSCICATFIRFHTAIGLAANGSNPTVPERDYFKYNRLHSRYPYKSHFQRGRALYGLVGTSLLVLLNGWKSLQDPFNPTDFVVSYLAIPIFALLTILYHIKLEGWNPWKWTIRRSCELRQPLPRTVGSSMVEILTEGDLRAENRRAENRKAERETRRGVIDLPDRGFSMQNLKNFAHWIWVWLQ